MILLLWPKLVLLYSKFILFSVLQLTVASYMISLCSVASFLRFFKISGRQSSVLELIGGFYCQVVFLMGRRRITVLTCDCTHDISNVFERGHAENIPL